MARSAEACELTAHVVVACSIQQCWDLYTNNQLVQAWSPAILEVECDSLVVDIDVVRKSTVLTNGKQGHVVEQCTQFDYLKRMEFSVLEETFGFSHMLNSYGFAVSFDVDGAHTLLVMQTNYVPKKIFASLMSAKSTQQQLVALMDESLQGFKRYVETSL